MPSTRIGRVPDVLAPPSAGGGARAGESPAGDILRTARLRAGLCVVLSRRSADLAIALSEKGNFLVQSLLADPGRLSEARDAIRGKGIYGRVSADRLAGGRLPYADNLVTLVVVEDVPAPATEEMLRVLCPGGVAWLGRGRTLVKPRPKEMDEWTHWLHGADGNAVARDTLVGPPRHVQWIAGPLWQRHHESVASPMGLVSAQGRLFYICDEAAAAVIGMPDRWFLIARDAFNGLRLWKRRMEQWGWKAWGVRENGGRFNQPIYISRRVVAVGDRVYVTLGFNAPVTALDAATGRTVRTYDGTRFTDEILHHEGLLILAVNQAPQKPGRIRKAPPVRKQVVVLDAATGKVLWRKGRYVGISPKVDSFERITHLSLAVAGGRVFLLDGEAIISLDLKTGREQWRAPRPADQPERGHVAYRPGDLCTLVAGEEVVLFAQPEEAYTRKTWNRGVKVRLLGLSARTGEVLWAHACGKWGPGVKPDVFVIDGLVWTHDAASYAAIGLDLSTGKVKRTFSTRKAFKEVHHHRCFRNKATERYLLTGRRGIEFIDLKRQECFTHHWVRGTCRYGVLPCNGLVYVPPHPCKCYIREKVNGFYALAPEQPNPTTQSAPGGRLVRGPAFGQVAGAPARPGAEADTPADDWPTYRADIRRSGSARSRAPAELNLLWKARIGPRPSAPVVAEGKVFSASVDEHRLCALGAADGRPAWSFTAGGRIDSPPTVHGGLVLFGSADGCVYCLRGVDGELVWRFRAAPQDRRIVAFGQLESAWCVNGSVLVQENVAFAAAGRSTHLDGGIHVCALEPATGRLIRELRPLNRNPHGLADVLVGDGKLLYMRHLKFGLRVDPGGDPKRRKAPAPSGPRAFSTAGLLDASWFCRVGWSAGAALRQSYELIVFDQAAVYGVQAYSKRGFGGYVRPGRNGYRLTATEPGSKTKRWSRRLPIRPVAMLVAGETLLLAGPPDAVDRDDPWAAFEGRKGAVLRAVSTTDGGKLAERTLDSVPVHDGLAAAGGRLYVSTADGCVLCLGAK